MMKRIVTGGFLLLLALAVVVPAAAQDTVTLFQQAIARMTGAGAAAQALNDFLDLCDVARCDENQAKRALMAGGLTGEQADLMFVELQTMVNQGLTRDGVRGYRSGLARDLFARTGIADDQLDEALAASDTGEEFSEYLRFTYALDENTVANVAFELGSLRSIGFEEEDFTPDIILRAFDLVSYYGLNPFDLDALLDVYQARGRAGLVQRMGEYGFLEEDVQNFVAQGYALLEVGLKIDDFRTQYYLYANGFDFAAINQMLRLYGNSEALSAHLTQLGYTGDALTTIMGDLDFLMGQDDRAEASNYTETSSADLLPLAEGTEEPAPEVTEVVPTPTATVSPCVFEDCGDEGGTAAEGGEAVVDPAATPQDTTCVFEDCGGETAPESEAVIEEQPIGQDTTCQFEDCGVEVFQPTEVIEEILAEETPSADELLFPDVDCSVEDCGDSTGDY